jgi:hypothetical protein
MKTLSLLSDLPSDCLLQIAVRLNLQDLRSFAKTSKKFRSVLSSDILKAALFFHQFGPDYWGEFVGVHQYTVQINSKMSFSYSSS